MDSNLKPLLFDPKWTLLFNILTYQVLPIWRLSSRRQVRERNVCELDILQPDFKGNIKMNEWISLLAKIGTTDDELTEQQARQLHFDLESSYNSFVAALANAST
ncbi:hypothetical protein V6N11_049670 [Hibiscus sabdariffa]|uniref:VPS28 C-terminal domain-containing protein n=1 Tax=Hibiscus sabdariffa TaxID=183260 RepID=A0ABR2A2R3_9ROSI